MKIVAIGGGEIGRPGYSVETTEIDKESKRLTGKKSPKALLIPTASGDDKGYYEVFEEHFGERLGCKTDVLYLFENDLDEENIKEKIFSSDIVYVGGGNTKKMMEEWRRRGLDRILGEAAKKDIVLSGVSAGAICWFKYGNSDSSKFESSGNQEIVMIEGLGLIDLMICPHYDVEEDRKASLNNMVDEYDEVAVALDNCSALEIIDNKYRVITSKEGAKAYKVSKRDGEVKGLRVDPSKKFKYLKSLLSK